METALKIAGLWFTASALTSFLYGMWMSESARREMKKDNFGVVMATMFPFVGLVISCFHFGTFLRELVCKDGGCE